MIKYFELPTINNVSVGDNFEVTIVGHEIFR